MKHTTQGIIISIILTFGTTGIAYIAGWDISSIGMFEYLGVFLSYVCTWLCVKRSVINFYVGILAVACYSVLFYQIELYSSMMLQLYMLPILIHGLTKWNKENDNSTQKVKFKTLSYIVLFSGIVTLITVLLDGKLPLMDSSIFFLSLIAQYLLIQKKVETWFVWAAVNVIAIITYFQAGAYLATLQYIAFLINAGYGYYEWKKGIKQ
jgi:nicotinamide mononucleotide transporter